MDTSRACETLGIVGVFWLQGALVRAVEDVRDGRVDLSIAETFNGVEPDIGRIAGGGSWPASGSRSVWCS